MKIKNQRSLISLCYVALFFCALFIVTSIGQFIKGINGMPWLEEIKSIQSLIFYGKYSMFFLLFVLLSAVIVNTIKGIKQNNPFPKANVALIYAIAAVDTVVKFCSDNWHVFNGESYLGIEDDVIITPILIVILGILYSVAHKASIDSNLSI